MCVVLNIYYKKIKKWEKLVSNVSCYWIGHFYGCVKFEFNYRSLPTKHDSELRCYVSLICRK